MQPKGRTKSQIYNSIFPILATHPQFAAEVRRQLGMSEDVTWRRVSMEQAVEIERLARRLHTEHLIAILPE